MKKIILFLLALFTAQVHAATVTQSSNAASLRYMPSGAGATATNIKQQLDNWITPENYTGSQRIQIQSAIDYASSIGGGNVWLKNGKTYTISAPLHPKSNVTVRLNGATITTAGAAGVPIFANNDVMMADDPFSVGVLTYYNLDTAINYKVGEKAITMQSAPLAANFAVNDYVWIRCRGLVTGSEAFTPVAELNQVESVAGAVVTLKYPLAKDYTYDAARIYGVAKASATLVKNFRVIGAGTLIADGYRAFQILESINTTVEGVTIKGIGAGVIRGRFSSILNNTIELTPNWVSGYRPYFWAWDTGQADSEFVGNNAQSKGVGILHIHEGCGNCEASKNKFQTGLVDVGAEVWPVISLRALGYGVKVTNNEIINSTNSSGIKADASTVYTTEGQLNLTIDGNRLSGVFGTYGIQVAAGSSDRGLQLTRNSIDGTMLGASNYELVVQNSTGAAVTNNILKSGAWLSDDTTRAGSLIESNYNYPTATKRWLDAGELALVAGAPAKATWRGARNTAWVFDGTALGSVGGNLLVPEYAKAATIFLWYANAGAGAGTVTWTVNSSSWADGENANAADSTLTSAGNTAGAQDVIKRVLVGAIGTLTAGKFMSLRVARDPNNAGDTLTNSAVLIGLEIVWR